MYYVRSGVGLRPKKASRSLRLIESLEIWAPKCLVTLCVSVSNLLQNMLPKYVRNTRCF